MINIAALPHPFTVFLLALTALVTTSCSTAPNARGWRALFNGRDTEGWQMVGPGELKLVDGELITQGGMGLLYYTKEKFGDCRLRVVFKLNLPTDNSGVFIRIPEPPQDPWFAVHRGYEVQIDNNGNDWQRTGCLYSLTEAKRRVHARVNEWNSMVITLEGPRTRVEINGALVTDFTEGQPVPPRQADYQPERGPRPAFGYIGLQNHGGDAQVHFRYVGVAALR